MKHIFLILLALATACSSVKNKKDNNSIPEDWMKDNIKSKEIVVLKVNAEEVECYGAHSKQKCLQIIELGKDNYWQNLYEGIQGFDFKSGFVYNLQVEKIVLKNPPQDAGDTFYKLIEVIKKEKPITDTMMSDYETLAVTKIQRGRDGYTATLKNDRGNLFVTTISIPNLEDNFVSLDVGDKVKIAGEYAESDPVQIFAKKIKVIERASLKFLPKLTVTKIENGKDGYTAHLIDEGKMTYTMVVSIPNLGENYIDLKVGDKLKAEGNYAESIPVRIYVKKIYKLK